MIRLGSTRRRRVLRGGPPRRGTSPRKRVWTDDFSDPEPRPQRSGPRVADGITPAARAPPRSSAVDHGLGPLKAKVWRIGLMDETSSKAIVKAPTISTLPSLCTGTRLQARLIAVGTHLLLMLY